MAKKPIYVHHIARDARMDSIGIPINPHRGAEKTKKQEFFTDLISLLIVPELVILFLIEWTGFLIGKYVLGKDIQKPKLKK